MAKPRKPPLPPGAMEVPGIPGSMMFLGPTLRDKSKQDQEELALIAAGMHALFTGDMDTYNRLGRVAKRLQQKRERAKTKRGKDAKSKRA